jgi:hypothetical protein
VYTFRAQLWQYDGPAPWYFISLPPDVADDIRAKFAPLASSFGSIKVQAAIRSTRWTTSLFPATTGRTYVLPIKKAARLAENLQLGDVATVSLQI